MSREHVKQSVRDLRCQIKIETEKAREKIQSLKTQIREIQESCPHPEVMYCIGIPYDYSYYYVCEDCGKHDVSPPRLPREFIKGLDKSGTTPIEGTLD